MRTVNIKGKDYVEVNERLKYFRSQEKYKDYSLESEIVALENGVITIKAIIKDGNGIIKATGLAQEKEDSSFINKTSFVENCETSAWGRALGNLGIGIDTAVASAEEVNNAINNQRQETDTDEKYLDELAACEDLETLKEVYKKNYNKVQNKRAYTQLKDMMKGQFTDDGSDYDKAEDKTIPMSAGQKYL